MTVTGPAGVAKGSGPFTHALVMEGHGFAFWNREMHDWNEFGCARGGPRRSNFSLASLVCAVPLC